MAVEKTMTNLNGRKFPLANSEDPDQTALRSSLIRVYTVCHSICIFWTHFSMESLLCLNLLLGNYTAKILGV